MDLNQIPVEVDRKETRLFIDGERNDFPPHGVLRVFGIGGEDVAYCRQISRMGRRHEPDESILIEEVVAFEPHKQGRINLVETHGVALPEGPVRRDHILKTIVADHEVLGIFQV